MARLTFEWDAADDEAGNVAHITRHGVTTSEAEYVVRNPNNDMVRSESSTYPITFGRTKTGKHLAVVWSAVGTNPMVIRVITAYPVNPPKGRR
ncbi:hypothetical protein P12x_006075 (plasmid) [Tundrisphaera lichenicola]|uniref:hypothetical protein n=1 Tax=Tundrisphaera lichenicola TaxID=2029860 RepID=UPI003EB8257E